MTPVLSNIGAPATAKTIALLASSRIPCAGKLAGSFTHYMTFRQGSS
jgi:hypothetical protein